MSRNVGGIDRILRIVVGLVLIALYFVAGLAAPWNLVSVAVGGVLLFTGVVGWCPPYALLGINTCSK